MSISRNIRIAGLSAFALVAASLFGAGAPARAQGAPTAFGQEMPQQYFLNRMNNPSRPAADGGASGGASGAVSGGGAQAAAEDDDGPGPFPKRYLLNKMFDNGNSAASAPAPAAPAAPASAAK